jgi:hypothetical protein
MLHYPDDEMMSHHLRGPQDEPLALRGGELLTSNIIVHGND